MINKKVARDKSLTKIASGNLASLRKRVENKGCISKDNKNKKKIVCSARAVTITLDDPILRPHDLSIEDSA